MVFYMLCNTTHALILPGIAVTFWVTSVLPFSLFSAKNASMTAYLLESSVARFKKCHVLFSTIACFLRLKESKRIPLLSGLLIISSMKESKKFIHCIHLKHFRVSGIKSSKFVTKKTSQYSRRLCGTYDLWKPHINWISLRGDTFTDVHVGYDLGQAETLLSCINRHRVWIWSVNTNGGNRIRTCYSVTQRNNLVIKLVIVYRWYENLRLE